VTLNRTTLERNHRMSIEKHADYTKEIQRLDETKSYLEATIATVMENRIKFKESIKDAYINLDYLDSSLSYSNIMLNSKLLDALEKNFDLLLHSRKKPYFARMDIIQENKDHVEELYIGKVSLFDPSMETPMVIDWRAPIASVYYDGRLGQAKYEAADAEHTIELLKKRQYTIEDGQLLEYMDVDISTSDTFLQASLDQHAGEKLKDIVSTIQAEQNRIIRADIDKPLIVQGVAGSGKTTIALHRIAYLIYTYAETFYPEQFMIIAPSTLFLDYISSVLPELGADKVVQTTYIDLMYEIIGKKVKLTDSNEKLNTLIHSHEGAVSDGEKHLISQAASFKNSMKMKELLDRYVDDIEQQILPQKGLFLDEFCLLEKSEIETLYQELYGYLPLYKRVESIKKYLTTFVRNKSKEILKRIEATYSKKIDRIRNREAETEERRQKLVALMDERELRLDQLQKMSKTVVKKYMATFYQKDLFAFYHELLENIGVFAEVDFSAELAKYIAQQEKQHHIAKKYEVEDLAPLAYLKERLFGLKNNLDIKMVVIDEAQDLSAFQFYVLRQMLETERFTILGDLAQGIHMYRSIENWDYIQHQIFKSEVTYLPLQQSYRTTVEIMEAANTVIDHANLDYLLKAKPVVRHGKKPEIVDFKSNAEVVKKIEAEISEWTQEGYTTMAVIAKSQEEAKSIYKHLRKLDQSLDMALIDEKSKHFNHRILIIPAHLAKGLEFDAVIITTLEEYYDKDSLDVKLFYVAMTRAMHRLSIIYKKDSIAYYA